jgi:endonuclease/exonuclease/phosphatase family metal-dependent hydrolase
MRKLLTILLLGVVITSGGWLLYHHEEIKSLDDAWALAQRQLLPARTANFASTTQNSELAPSQVLRIAAFNIQTFGPKKMANEVVMTRLAEICQKFDLIAIQEIRGEESQALTRLVQRMNAAGAAQFAFVCSPPQGRGSYREQAAFLFNQQKVRLDDAFSYTVQDPDELMVRPPFVGWFRAAEPRPDQAFTFTLVNVHIDPQQPAKELVYLPDLFRAIRKDGRGEDDIIIAGDFNAGDRGLEHIRSLGLTWAITNQPTNTRHTAQYDNLVFDMRATTEFLGASGVLNFVKHFNISLDEALEISDHQPIWGDFAIYEGFGPGKVAVDDQINDLIR